MSKKDFNPATDSGFDYSELQGPFGLNSGPKQDTKEDTTSTNTHANKKPRIKGTLKLSNP